MCIKASLADAYPTLIVEVAYSQQTERVRDVCQQYVRRSKGAVQCAIAIDLPYSAPQAATLALYRPTASSTRQASVRCDAIHTFHALSESTEPPDPPVYLNLLDILAVESPPLQAECDRTMLETPLFFLADALRQGEESLKNPQKRRRKKYEVANWSSSPSEDEYLPEAPLQPKRVQMAPLPAGSGRRTSARLASMRPSATGHDRPSFVANADSNVDPSSPSVEVSEAQSSSVSREEAVSCNGASAPSPTVAEVPSPIIAHSQLSIVSGAPSRTKAPSSPTLDPPSLTTMGSPLIADIDRHGDTDLG
ncbi:hypothetical protein LTR17_026953 [Elasticomyces elasticus]|nr:hypothetical protein LTR17_026953 [Elasticomyces elasticus]